MEFSTIHLELIQTTSKSFQNKKQLLKIAVLAAKEKQY